MIGGDEAMAEYDLPLDRDAEDADFLRDSSEAFPKTLVLRPVRKRGAVRSSKSYGELKVSLQYTPFFNADAPAHGAAEEDPAKAMEALAVRPQHSASALQCPAKHPGVQHLCISPPGGPAASRVSLRSTRRGRRQPGVHQCIRGHASTPPLTDPGATTHVPCIIHLRGPPVSVPCRLCTPLQTASHTYTIVLRRPRARPIPRAETSTAM